MTAGGDRGVVGQPVEEARTRWSWLALLTGPKAASSSSGMPTLAEVLAYSASAATKSSWMRGAASTRVAAVQSCPALK